MLERSAGEENAGALTVLASHHAVGGRVIHNYSGASLMSKVSVHLVDPLMGSIVETVAGRTGDTVTSIRTRSSVVG